MPSARKTSLENVRVRPNDDLALNLRRRKGFGSNDVNGQIKPVAAASSQRHSYAGTGIEGLVGVKAGGGNGENGFDVVREEEVDEEESGESI